MFIFGIKRDISMTLYFHMGMIVEVLPKIAYHLEFLLQNPDIKILVSLLFALIVRA